MIYAVVPENKQEELEILESMPKYKDANYSIVCGLKKNNKYIGGVLVLNQEGNFIAWQWENTGDPTLGSALTSIFEILFSKYTLLHGSIDLLNTKSLKAAKQVGFYNLYKENDSQIVGIRKETWKLKKKVR